MAAYEKGAPVEARPAPRPRRSRTETRDKAASRGGAQSQKFWEDQLNAQLAQAGKRRSPPPRTRRDGECARDRPSRAAVANRGAALPA